LEGLALGLDNSGIAHDLHIARPTVALHLVNARKKLGALTREQAVARAVALGLIRLGVTIWISSSSESIWGEGLARLSTGA
jgi:regulatory LuxR family protein